MDFDVITLKYKYCISLNNFDFVCSNIDEKLKNYDIPMDVVTECVRLWNMMNEQIKKKTKGKKLFSKT